MIVNKQVVLKKLNRYIIGEMTLENLSNWSFEIINSKNISYQNNLTQGIVHFINNPDINDIKKQDIINIIDYLNKNGNTDISLSQVLNNNNQ